MMPPPPPPPMPPGGWAPAKPTSGKAIASLVLGLIGIVGVFCYLPAVGAFIGAILGILGILESGKSGTRAGRGMAIAGTILSVLAVVGTAAWLSFYVFMVNKSKNEFDAALQEHLAQDQQLLAERVQQYCVANNNNLGPGGPVLAGGSSGLPAGTAPANQGGANNLVVTGALDISHLVSDDELEYGGGRGRRGGGVKWELRVTGPTSATLRARNWNGEVVREAEIPDAVTGRVVQTIP